MKTGIIDFGEVDSNSIETIHHTIDNAVLAEAKGFSRYWLTEHHVNGVAWKNPELIISLIAASTESIRIGAAGVLPSVSHPYRIAQDYKLLSNLFYNRIDLGFAKGGMNPQLHQELNGNTSPPDFFERIRKTKHYLSNEVQNQHLFSVPGILPHLWMLGSSTSSMDFAIKERMNFSLSLFHNMPLTLPSPPILNEFKATFFQQNGYAPFVNIAVSVFCHEDQARVREEIRTRKNVAVNVFGNAKECLAQMKKLSQDYEVEEVIVLNLGKNQKEKQFLLEHLSIANQILR
jgi:luciferase family oxidoreductase group 1